MENTKAIAGTVMKRKGERTHIAVVLTRIEGKKHAKRKPQPSPYRFCLQIFRVMRFSKLWAPGIDRFVDDLATSSRG